MHIKLVKLYAFSPVNLSFVSLFACPHECTQEDREKVFPYQQPSFHYQPMCLPSPFYLMLGHITSKVFNSMCTLLCKTYICNTFRQKYLVKGHKKMSYEELGIFHLEKKKSKGRAGDPTSHKSQRG